MNTVAISTEIQISCPIALVYEYAIDPDTVMEWHSNITSVNWETEKPLVIGSRIAFGMRLLRQQMIHSSEVIELVPQERMVMHVMDDHFELSTTYTWTSLSDDETKMTATCNGHLRGFSSVISRLAILAMGIANKKSLRAIKSVLEVRY